MNRRCVIEVEWEPDGDIGDSVVQAVVEASCDHLMTVLCRLGVNDPTVSASLNAPRICSRCDFPVGPQDECEEPDGFVCEGCCERQREFRGED